VRVAIVGGKLQGVEAAFLAGEAGWEAVLIDRKSSVPAAGLCQSFYQCDVVRDASSLRRVIEKVDLVIPALEDATALGALEECAADACIPLAYDASAYFVTHSKKRSNRLFEKLGVPLPQSWPQCGLPLIAKPSTASGSQGVSMISTEEELNDFVRRAGSHLGQWVLQEYVEGPSYSIEVLGWKGHYITLQITELEMDEHYDCQRVLAPALISQSLDRQIREIALTIADGLNLTGIMDVEVIVSRDDIKVLEIDARLPSQTPTAVYKSTGVNILELLRDIFVTDTAPAASEAAASRGVVYEHIRVSPNGLQFQGEHIMGEAESLKAVPDFFGADIALTNFDPSSFPWAATLITTGENREQVWLKREKVIKSIEGFLVEDRASASNPGDIPSLSRG